MDPLSKLLHGPPHTAYWRALVRSPLAAAAIDVNSGRLLKSNPAFERFTATLGAGMENGLDKLSAALTQHDREALRGDGGEQSTVVIESLGPVAVECSPIDHRAGVWLVCVPDAVFETTRDEVTGVADRRCLMADLQRRSLGEDPFAVVFVDLNGFKQVNDLLGHMAGDRVLREVAQRIDSCLRECDLVGRFGGDEFVVLLDHVSCEAELAPVTTRIQKEVARPLASIPEDAGLSASVGWSLSVDGLESVAEMLAAADTHMYANKQATT
ncbi:MAG: GGDEF domain-containing protein [Planctomycetales bacterium]|nr:GGDEF domain-containing protein [Planctomycetales bacterium]